MEITLEMLDNDRISVLLVAGDNCYLNISNLVKVFEPLTEYAIITTFEIVQFGPKREIETLRYHSLVDALHKFNEIEEGE